MASLREEARWILGDAKAGIDWIAVWKTGRTWHAETMIDVVYEDARPRFHEPAKWLIGDDDATRLKEIFAEDENAILVNPYYCNLGPFEEMTLDSLIDGIRFQYSFGGDIMSILQKAGRA